MTDEAELEAQIRARDAYWNDGKQWNGSVQYAIRINSSQLYLDGQSTMVGDRRTLLRLLDEARAELDIQRDVGQWHIHDVVKALEDNEALRAELADTAARLAKAEAEAEVERLRKTMRHALLWHNDCLCRALRTDIEAALSPAPPSETP